MPTIALKQDVKAMFDVSWSTHIGNTNKHLSASDFLGIVISDWNTREIERLNEIRKEKQIREDREARELIARMKKESI